MSAFRELLTVHRAVLSKTFPLCSDFLHTVVCSLCCIKVTYHLDILNHLLFPSSVPHLTEIHPSKLEVSLLDRFPVTFGVEGSSLSLVCTMVVVPNLPNVPPLAQWYRDGNT